MNKKQLLEKKEALEHNVRVLTNNNQIQYDNIKKYEKKLERLAEIGKATELAFNKFNGSMTLDVYNKTNIGETILSVEHLLKWYKKEEEKK